MNFIVLEIHKSLINNNCFDKKLKYLLETIAIDVINVKT